MTYLVDTTWTQIWDEAEQRWVTALWVAYRHLGIGIEQLEDPPLELHDGDPVTVRLTCDAETAETMTGDGIELHADDAP